MQVEFSGIDWSNTTELLQLDRARYISNVVWAGPNLPLVFAKIDNREFLKPVFQQWARVARPAFDWRSVASFRPDDPVFVIHSGGDAQALIQWRENYLVPCANGARLPLLYVSFLEVAPSNRGQLRHYVGLGPLLLRFASERSLATGTNGVIGLHSVDRAVNFYESLGFRRQDCPNEYHELYLELEVGGVAAFLART